MKIVLVRLGFVFCLCTTILLMSGCAQQKVSVVNTNSGIVIHADEYTRQLNIPETKKSENEINKSNGNVINLGSGYESIDLPPLNRF